MSMLGKQIKELHEMADAMHRRSREIGLDYGMGRGLADASRMLREAADTIESLRDRLQESYGQVPEQGKRENEGEQESCGEACGDDRFELIGKAKRKLFECTNIESRPEEVAVLDSILFRCWQMGWLDQLRDSGTRWHELFGTPERAAQTLTVGEKHADCSECIIREACYSSDMGCLIEEPDALLEWLSGDAE